MTFPPYLWGFLAKNQKILEVGEVETKDEVFFFREKNFSFSFNPSLQKTEGAEYAGGSRLSCSPLDSKAR